MGGSCLGAYSAYSRRRREKTFKAPWSGRCRGISRHGKLQSAMPLFKERAKSFVEMSDSAHFLLSERPFEPDEKASALLNSVSIGILNKLTSRLQHATWTHENIEETLREFAQDQSLKLGEVMQPLRAALTGRTVSPSVFNLMEILGRPESLARLEDAINRPQ